MKNSKIKYIYVLDPAGQPVMPTKRLGMVRRWLKTGQAHWYKNKRDTIQFNRPVAHHLQKVVQGCDLGNHLGISVITNGQEVYASESYCNGNDTHERLQARKMYRQTRRNRLRHRKERFNNRKKHEKYVPSIKRKLDFQIKEIARIGKFLPISQRIFEGSVFDINKLTHHAWQQQGYRTLLDFLYVRDHGCDALDGKQYSKNQLVIHHLIHRADGGTNNPDNLVLLTREHHNQANHVNGVLDKLAKARQKVFENVDTRGAYFMNILNVELPKYFNYLPTFGYLTKAKRDLYYINKSHHDDAFVIASGTNQVTRLTYCIYREKLRDNNRSLEKFYDAKYRDLRDGQTQKSAILSSGRTSRSRNKKYDNQRIYRANKIKAGRRAIRTNHYSIRPYDLVKYNNYLYEAKGIHNHGKSIMLRSSNKQISRSINKVTCVYHANGIQVIIK